MGPIAHNIQLFRLARLTEIFLYVLTVPYPLELHMITSQIIGKLNLNTLSFTRFTSFFCSVLQQEFV